MQESDSPEISPFALADILIHDFEQNRFAPDGETDVESKSRSTKLIQIGERSIELLKSSGYEDLLAEALTTNEEFYNNLLMKVYTERVLEKPQTDSVVSHIFSTLEEELRDVPLTPPDLGTYSQQLPAPFDTVLGIVLLLDTAFQQGRYAVMRDASNKLLGQ